ncbi:MAG: UV DNA damage repair endonuclease UvsE [Desulfobacterales bacterium]|nr:MAG: UV DNA damage repair endonuclease UvsE [Desulfobacterales bacterium]
MIRFGLCCLFREEAIKFRRTTVKYLKTLPLDERLRYLAAICRHNAQSLFEALQFCRRHAIGDFRINSQILPVKTHPEVKYRIEELPGYDQIVDTFKDCGAYARRHGLRTTFHPDQFIVLSSPNKEVVRRAIADLAYHAEVAEWVHADVINIHAGGAYGDKAATLRRLAQAIMGLPEAIRSRLTLENDDRVYTPQDLLPICRDTGIPLVYDVHHHRCLPDGQGVAKITSRALSTWNREPLFHLSSPLTPWGTGNPRNHHDFIDPADFPQSWQGLDITVEVEAKAKEVAVLKLKGEIGSRAKIKPNKPQRQS